MTGGNSTTTDDDEPVTTDDASAADQAAEPTVAGPADPTADGGADAPPSARTLPGGLLDDAEAARRYLAWAAVALLALLAVVATVRVYTSASTAIVRFVAPALRPVFEAAFNLVVLLLALAGITRLLRGLRAAD